MTQLDLFENRFMPTVTPDDEREFMAVLSCGAWLKAGYICECMEIPATESGKRIIRAIAERVFPLVISGQRGYRLTRYATLEEIDEAEAVYRNAAKKLEKKAYDLRLERNKKQNTGDGHE